MPTPKEEQHIDADTLQEQIDRLVHGEPDVGKESADESSKETNHSQSLRDFVQEQMVKDPKAESRRTNE